MGAKHLLEEIVSVHKLMKRFIQTYCHDLSVIANKNANEKDRKNAILKRDRAKFLGGTSIHHLFKW